eukprot:6181449-Pleurochrysis_carterae.AAC.3
MPQLGDGLDAILLLGDDLVPQVGPVERAHEADAVREAEDGDDVVQHALGGGGGERHHGHGGEVELELGQLLVVGPEVVAPLRHAVRLVNHEALQRAAPEQH